MEYFRIKGWDQYQHYKDRSPPWIKLHKSILTSRTWVAMDDQSRVLAIACMLLAADTDNKIPLDPVYVQRVAYLNHEPDFAPLLKNDFIEIIEEEGETLARASKPLAIRTTETETEKKNLRALHALFERFWASYPKRRSRDAALKAFTKINPDEQLLAVMLAAIERAKTRAEWRKDKGQFIPYPATWLNSGGWKDEDAQLAPAPREFVV